MIVNPALFILPHNEIQEYGIDNLIYGSLTDKGLATMATTIQRWMPSTETHYGLDLGCGDGELVYQLQRVMSGSTWEGVEISEHRVSCQTRDVTIWQGNMLAENLRPYNILHADNLCLTDSIADALEEKIATEFHGLYISYRRAENIPFLKKATLLGTVPTETTWTVHSIYYYWL
jgi:hypothetical protein